MDHSLDKKIETKEKVLILLKKQIKLYIFSTVIIALLLTFYWIKESKSKENILLSENFIKGRILLDEEKKKRQRDILKI